MSLLEKLRRRLAPGESTLRGLARVAAVEAMGLLAAPVRTDSARDPSNQAFAAFVARVNSMTAPRILELGSRNVTGTVRRGLFPSCGEYVGFDIHPGENVDRTGDIHELSSLLPAGRFDVVHSVAVFEHLAMPWKAVLEINRVMADGGLLYVSTHGIFPPHELPWDFWRYSPAAFAALLNHRTGFEILETTEGLPCVIVGLASEGTTHRIHRSRCHMVVSVLARKIGPSDSRLDWGMAIADFSSTTYPEPAAARSPGGTTGAQ